MEENTVVNPAEEIPESSTNTGGDTIVNIAPTSDVISRSVVINDYVIDGDGGLSGIVNAVFGEYQPRTQTVTEVFSDGTSSTYTEVVDGFAGLDWYWLGGVLVFSIVLISFFKFLGAVFKGR